MSCAIRLASNCGSDDACGIHVRRLTGVAANRVVIDGVKSQKYFRSVAKEITSLPSGASSGLSLTTAHKIGGGGDQPDHRTTFLSSAFAYARLAGICIEEILYLGPDPARQVELTICSPNPGGVVGPHTAVEGRISGVSPGGFIGTIWVLIKPDSDFIWVQRPASVSGIEWRSETRFGNADTPDCHHFTIWAILDPEKPLRVGQMLKEVPQGRFVSRAVGVRYKFSGGDSE